MSVEPFVWLPKGLGEGPLHEAVGQSIGAASMCWVGGPGDREFDSMQASQVVDGLMAYLSDYMDGVRAEANNVTAAKLGARLGLASTREMLEELQARGQVGALSVVQGDDRQAYDYDRLDRASARLLATLRADTLDYRTVS